MKLKYILLTFVATLLLVSCELDRLPKGQISDATFWTNENDVEKALMGCYEYVDGSVYDAYIDGYADNSYCQYPWESKATIISAGNINTDMDAGYNFVGIRRFNYFLENIDKVKMDKNLKEQYKAEVKVLRAWKYFNLANKFGDMPLFKKSVETAEEAGIAPTPESEVIDFVLSELESAVPNLSQGKVKSRISKGMALTLKARVELTYAKWDKAVQSTKKVMDMGYKLFEKDVTDADIASDDDYSKFISFADDADKKKFYKALHSYQSLFFDANKENSEVIFNSEAIADSYNYIALYLLSDNAGGGWSSITPTISLVNSYWKRDGSEFVPPTKEARASAYNKGTPTADYIKEFQDRDTRLYATVLFPGAMWKAIGVDNFTWNKGGSNISKTGYNYRKMVDNNFNVWHNETDYPIMRYAEVLLMYAEAKNEVSGPDATIYAALNLIRKRAGMPEIDKTTNNTKETLRKTIRNERRIELAGEGLRWLDIRRWDIAKDVMKSIYAIDGDLAQERRWEAKFKRLPYPQAAVDRNENLKAAQAAKGY